MTERQRRHGLAVCRSRLHDLQRRLRRARSDGITSLTCTAPSFPGRAGLRLRRPARCAALGVGIVYSAAVANLTLWSVGSGLQPASSGVPLGSIEDYLSNSVSLSVAVHNVGGNLVMLGPLGILLAVVTRWSGRRAAVVLFLVSATIELLQWQVVSGRSADVDDAILNVAGGILGYWLGRARGARPHRAFARRDHLTPHAARRRAVQSPSSSALWPGLVWEAAGGPRSTDRIRTDPSPDG